MIRRISYEEFFTKAILNLRDTSKSKGIHTVYSGFNQAFREYYSSDPIPITQELVKKGIIELKPVKGGVMIYLPGEGPSKNKLNPSSVLTQIMHEPEKKDRSLVETVINQIKQEGLKIFPQNFIKGELNKNNSIEISLPSTNLQLEHNSQTIIISPKRHFKYEARNPPLAKYILYSYKISEKSLTIPNDNKTIFTAVTEYEQYCKQLKITIFQNILDETNNETVAENLTDFVIKELNLKPLLIDKNH